MPFPAAGGSGGIDAPHLFIRLACVIGQQTQSFLNRIKKNLLKYSSAYHKIDLLLLEKYFVNKCCFFFFLERKIKG